MGNKRNQEIERALSLMNLEEGKLFLKMVCGAEEGSSLLMKMPTVLIPWGGVMCWDGQRWLDPLKKIVESLDSMKERLDEAC